MSTCVLVTGASSGIGAGIVEVLTQAGFDVHAVARREDRLSDLSRRTGCKAHALDVRDRAAMAELVDDIQPDAVVLCAGLGGGFAGLTETSAEEVETVIGTNMTSVFHLLRAALPGMIARGRGHVVTIGSVAALYPSISSLYGASKAAIAMLAQNLRLELAGTGLRVTDIRPGRVSSEFYDVANPQAKSTGIRELDPGDVGEAVRYALAAPWHVNVSAIELQPREQSYGGMAFVPRSTSGDAD